MLKFRNQKFFNNGPNLLGLFITLAGITALVGTLFFYPDEKNNFNLIIGLISMGLGIVLMTFYSGKILDFQRSQFKEYFSVLGITYGSWKDLPPIQKAELVQHEYVSRSVPNAITPSFYTRNLVFKIALISAEKVELVLEFFKEKEALKALEKINSYF